MPEIVIALDAMGGDNAPGAAVEGAIAALEEWKDARILLFGQKGIAQPRERLELVETTEVITNDEAPMLAVRKKPGSSMVSAILSVKEGRAQAMVPPGRRARCSPAAWCGWAALKVWSGPRWPR